MLTEVKESCRTIYNSTYDKTLKRLKKEKQASSKKRLKPDDEENLKKEAQKEAILKTTIANTMAYPDVSLSIIWQFVYEVHISHKSGIDDEETIRAVVSADQSWKKTSGHVFEQIIKLFATEALEGTGIEIILQKDLNVLIKEGLISNEPRDISWLKEQIKGSVFDLYAVITKEDKQKFCFGCIQSKTSIRDRVSRDREPSLQAMQSFFWSVAIVLDGDYLTQKFTNMVNGGTVEYPDNGWHALYVLSNQSSAQTKRIYDTDLNFRIFKEHAIKASQYWLTQRQWFTKDWSADDK